MRIRPGGHESQLVLLPVPALKPALDLPTGQSMQLTVELVSSFSLVEYLPFGQDSQAVCGLNGFNSGLDMKVPAGQHPSRPVDVNPLLEDNDCHWPPHKVRLKPLDWNTAEEGNKTNKERNNETILATINKYRGSKHKTKISKRVRSVIR